MTQGHTQKYIFWKVCQICVLRCGEIFGKTGSRLVSRWYFGFATSVVICGVRMYFRLSLIMVKLIRGNEPSESVDVCELGGYKDQRMTWF